MKIEIYPRAEADIIRQFRYYLVDQDAPAVAFRFRDAVRESVDQLKTPSAHGHLISGLDLWLSFLASKRLRGYPHLLC